MHLVDVSREDPIADYTTIRSELTLYSSELAQKEEIIVLSKSDMREESEVTEVARDLHTQT